MKETIKKSIIGWLVFVSTVFVWGLLYAAIGSSWTNPSTLEVWAGSGLTATSWNNLLANFNNLDTRVNTINNRPVFSVYLNQASSAAKETWAKVPFNAIEYDSNSFFNTSTNRFQPTIAGYYSISLTISTTATSPTWSTMYAALNKNGATIRNSYNLIAYTGQFNQTMSIPTIVYMNGTTDYIDAWYLYNGATVNLTQGLAYTYMQWSFLRP